MPILIPAIIARQILTDTVGRMSDLSIGFNAQLPLVIANNPQYQANAQWLTTVPLQFPADYTGQSLNVVLAPIDVDEWLSSSNVQISCPGNALLMQIFVISAVNQANSNYKEKGRIFDGLVTIGIHCHVLWPNQQVVYDFDAPTSAVEDTIMNIFNWNTTAYQSWSKGTIYNGVLSVPGRSSIKQGATGWQQLTTFTIQFGLIK